MSLTIPELSALARVRVDFSARPGDPDGPKAALLAPTPDVSGPVAGKAPVQKPEPVPFLAAAVYEYSNGFDAEEVEGARGAPPIFVDTRNRSFSIVLFLTDPIQPGSESNQGGIKAVFNVVSVATPLDPIPLATFAFPSGAILYQYGDYTLGGLSSPISLPSTPYANVNPQKALRFRPPAVFDNVSVRIDVSVFRNPMTMYR